MSDKRPAPITLLTQLLVDFCIPAIKGQVAAAAPLQGAEVSAEVRRTLGIKTTGRTIAYPADGATVFLDLNEQRAQVWFIHPDAHKALDPVEKALARAVPGLGLTHEAQPMPGLGERILLGELGNGRGVRIEISHPAGGSDNFFVVRTVGLQITDAASFKKQTKGGA